MELVSVVGKGCCFLGKGSWSCVLCEEEEYKSKGVGDLLDKRVSHCLIISFEC